MSYANASWHGSAAAAGVLTMRSNPDYTRGKYGVQAVPVAAFRHANVTVRIAGTATVALQGCNGDTETAADWHEIGSITATGNISADVPWKYLRVNVTSWTSGDVVADLEVSCS